VQQTSSSTPSPSPIRKPTPTATACLTNLFEVSVLSSPSSVLRWNSVSGRVYTVYWTSNLLSNFQTLETNLPWTEMPYTDTNESATGQGFYKIDVELE